MCVTCGRYVWPYVSGGPLSDDDDRSKAELAILAKGWLRFGEWELHPGEVRGTG